MNDQNHLTAVQFDTLLIGDTDSTAQAHLAACPICAAQLASTRSSLDQFGEALTVMAREERFRRNTQANLLHFRASTTRRPFSRLTATFALAASVALVAVIVPFSHMAAPPSAQTPVTVGLSAASTVSSANVQSDEALLNEIDQQLSASVPSALAPLADPTKQK